MPISSRRWPQTFWAHANDWVDALNLGVTLQSEDELAHSLKQNLPTIGGQVATESLTIIRTIVTQTTLTLIFVAFMLAGRDPHAVRQRHLRPDRQQGKALYCDQGARLGGDGHNCVYHSAGDGVADGFVVRVAYVFC